jgi:phosphonate transport system substrate-binding protein
VVGVLPDESETQLRARYTPLVRYLENATGLALELSVPATYDDLVADFARGEVDLAWFGALTMAQAIEQSDARPLVMRDIDLGFVSLFLVPARSSAETLQDLRGRTLAFGSRFSTSGHLMPRYFMEEEGITPETHFGSVVYTGAHDSTAYLVRHGEVDVGVANSAIIRAMFAEGRLDSVEVKVLQQTPRYRNYAWATHEDLDPAVRDLLLEAFMALDMNTPEHAHVLMLQDAGGFVPARREDFNVIADIADRMGLLVPDGPS